MSIELTDVEFIFGNSNKRFSGVTSTMLQVLPHIAAKTGVAVLGGHHVPDGVPVFTFFQAARTLRHHLPDGRCRIFHARRNDEMIQALVLKYIFRSKIRIVFTSTAQRPKTWFTRWLMSHMDGLLSTCTAAADYMSVPPDVIIPHGVDLSFFKATASDDSAGLELPATYNIGLFGRVRAQKGVDLLVEAAIQLLVDRPQWGVVFVGEITSEQKSFQREQVIKLEQVGVSDRVVFTGKVSFESLPRYFRAIDIGCALSVNEGFGLTVLEAGACGKPIVATKAGAWPDILSDSEAGFLIDIGDVDGLVSVLKGLMSNLDDRLRRGRIAKELVESCYTSQREADALVNYYRSKAS